MFLIQFRFVINGDVSILLTGYAPSFRRQEESALSEGEPRFDTGFLLSSERRQNLERPIYRSHTSHHKSSSPLIRKVLIPVLRQPGPAGIGVFGHHCFAEI